MGVSGCVCGKEVTYLFLRELCRYWALYIKDRVGTALNAGCNKFVVICHNALHVQNIFDDLALHILSSFF